MSSSNEKRALSPDPAVAAPVGEVAVSVVEAPVAKKAKIEDDGKTGEEVQTETQEVKIDARDARDHGIARVKAEFRVPKSDYTVTDTVPSRDNDDESELNGREDTSRRQKRERGQNKNRKFGKAHDVIRLCEAIKDGGVCSHGDQCKYEHDLSKYIASKPEDLSGTCPVYEAIGYCPAGVKCRWMYSHWSKESNKSLVDEAKKAAAGREMNRIDRSEQLLLQRKKFPTPKSDLILPYLESVKEDNIARNGGNGGVPMTNEERADNAATYIEAPIKPGEKKRLNYSHAKILSPLTTVGNLPFRRLCREFGANVTYSEMALALPLLQGTKPEWALPRTHTDEIGGFGVQIAAPKPWQAIKATEALVEYCEVSAGGLSEINLNCGCPIDLVYRSGAGSALLDAQTKMLRMLKGMNAVSGEVPITVKLRMGTRDKTPIAKKLVQRLVREGDVAAITLHGRSRQQRYTRLADWQYISETAQIARDTFHEVEDKNKDGPERAPVWFIGNGDCYSWKDWWDAVDNYNVDSVMIARGALIKPWIFEEIDAKQYLDKTATERLEMIKRFAHLGLEHWGSDEYGINNCRRFLCEFLSFSCRYVPVGILETLPPRLQDRPEKWKGRNELETLLGSGDYRDWIKISEMVLGPCHENFEFQPKHKSNAYEQG
ncbi:tRNA-dihydrouridine(47) synthase [NAD(P)(+)] [Myxozyma melibiosi]|uniref:tRNA-dihydrouridine(47) synthase [NAD(P)(+)] n=1 Tax=Myxozyma melibiosi TaxID=54550 RepID=A0ABR1FED3_9ASCO